MKMLRLTLIVDMDFEADKYVPAPEFQHLPLLEAMLRTEQVELLNEGTNYISMILDGYEYAAKIEIIDVDHPADKLED